MLAVRQGSRDPQPALLTGDHELEPFGPAGDHLADAELERRLADGGVEDLTGLRPARVVHLHLVGGPRVILAGARSEDLRGEPRRRLRRVRRRRGDICRRGRRVRERARSRCGGSDRSRRRGRAGCASALIARRGAFVAREEEPEPEDEDVGAHRGRDFIRVPPRRDAIVIRGPRSRQPSDSRVRANDEREPRVQGRGGFNRSRGPLSRDRVRRDRTSPPPS